MIIIIITMQMNNAWAGLGDAPPGTIKNKIHSLGLRLLSRVPPSEVFLKSISNDVSTLQVLYPSMYTPTAFLFLFYTCSFLSSFYLSPFPVLMLGLFAEGYVTLPWGIFSLFTCTCQLHYLMIIIIFSTTYTIVGYFWDFNLNPWLG